MELARMKAAGRQAGWKSLGFGTEDNVGADLLVLTRPWKNYAGSDLPVSKDVRVRGDP